VPVDKTKSNDEGFRIAGFSIYFSKRKYCFARFSVVLDTLTTNVLTHDPSTLTILFYHDNSVMELHSHPSLPLLQLPSNTNQIKTSIIFRIDFLSPNAVLNPDGSGSVSVEFLRQGERTRSEGGFVILLFCSLSHLNAKFGKYFKPSLTDRGSFQLF
jgi:hypothetical protein